MYTLMEHQVVNDLGMIFRVIVSGSEIRLGLAHDILLLFFQSFWLCLSFLAVLSAIQYYNVTTLPQLAPAPPLEGVSSDPPSLDC